MKTKTNAIQVAIRIVPAVLMLLLSACGATTAVPTQAPTAALPASEETPIPTARPTQAPADSANPGLPEVSVDVSAAAQGVTSMTVMAAAPGTDRPWWEILPQHLQLTLQGYPLSSSLMQPQIFVYPAADLGVNDAAAKAAADLRTLLESQQTGESLPFLPLNNDVQMMHAQVQFLAFKNGSGVRYLTQYAQGIVPVNNRTLFYTFQGLTADGRYYVVAVLPVNLDDLPADTSASADLPAAFTENYPQYVLDTAEMLNQQAVSAFTPDLGALDAVMQSIEVK